MREWYPHNISVSFFTCGNDVLIISRCGFRYLFSYLTEKLCFKNWEKPNGKVLKSKLSFKNIAIFAVEYLNKKNSWYVKFSNVILFLLSLETWKHLKRVKDHPLVIFQNACLTVPLIFILSLMFVNKILWLN